MHEVQAEMGRDGGVKPALTVAETVADARQPGEEDVAEPAHRV